MGAALRHVVDPLDRVRNTCRAAVRALLRGGARQHGDRRRDRARTTGADGAAAGRCGRVPRPHRLAAVGADCARLCRGAAAWRSRARTAFHLSRSSGCSVAVGTAFRDLIGRKVDAEIPIARGRLRHAAAGDGGRGDRVAAVRALGGARWAASAAARLLRAAAQPRAFLHLPRLPHRRDVGCRAVLLQLRGVGGDRGHDRLRQHPQCARPSRASGSSSRSGVAVVLVDVRQRQPVPVETPVA